MMSRSRQWKRKAITRCHEFGTIKQGAILYKFKKSMMKERRGNHSLTQLGEGSIILSLGPLSSKTSPSRIWNYVQMSSKSSWIRIDATLKGSKSSTASNLELSKDHPRVRGRSWLLDEPWFEDWLPIEALR